ncbi:tetratricopeptide repeat protein [Psychrosphaera aestuarii]|uniref:tetratricopeptide repeat protein n=1 Tax=Psychrosphaera aestuarii TaxID=1266052 RepID=UPI001B325F09|nr:tetratricopeptide repeat protein [Psychrosphaera aestuarii]
MNAKLALIKWYVALMLLGFFSSSINANNNSDCLAPSKQCLEFANAGLQDSTPYTFKWFNLKIHQIESLISIKEFNLAKQEINEIDLAKAPATFVSYVTMYKAKVLIVEGKKEQALQLLFDAKLNLIKLNDVFYSPMRSIYIANLLQDLGKIEESLDILLSIKNKFSKSKNIHLMLELYGNLGHAYRRMENYQLSLEHYLEALPFAKALNNNQQIMVIYTHIGNSYIYMQNFKNAEPMLKKALKYAQLDDHKISITTAKINLTYFLLNQNKLNEAKKLALTINPGNINTYQLKTWDIIKTRIQSVP